MNYPSLAALPVGTEENRRAKDPFKRSNQSPVFLAALLHTEHVEHFRPASEPYGLALLPDGERCQEYGHDSVLPEGQAMLRITRYLEEEVPFRRSNRSWPDGGRRTGSRKERKDES